MPMGGKSSGSRTRLAFRLATESQWFRMFRKIRGLVKRKARERSEVTLQEATYSFIFMAGCNGFGSPLERVRLKNSLT